MSGDKAVGWIRFEGIELDLDGHRLRVNGAEVPLEPKAFAVLALLARHSGHVLTRDQILDVVWGHAHVTPSVLNRIITLLRQALGESGEAHRYLHTVHGVGYRFDLPATASGKLDVAEPAPSIEAQTAHETDPVVAPPVTTQAGNASAGLRAAAWAIPVLALLAVAGWMLWPHMQHTRLADTASAPSTPSTAGTTPAPQPISVAVLPLVNATGDPNQQFFADGISENLIGALTQYEGLKVIGRDPAFRFRDTREDVKAIGARLGVTLLVEGSVQRDADRVRIGIELIRTGDGTVVWSQRFDRPYKDLFALQDEVTLAVASALQVKLMQAMPYMVKVGRPASGNLQAYEAYLRGTYFMAAGGKDWGKAIEEFTRATQLDPDYAQAWAWLGHARTLLAYDNTDRNAARAGYAQARVDIDTAIRLQPNFGQAHAIRANWFRSAQHDWNTALAEFRIALLLVPADDPTHGAVSILLTTRGRVREAITERKKYIDGDPLTGFPHMYLVRLQASLGRLDEADASLRTAVQLDPDQTDWHASASSYLAILRGDAKAAVDAARRMQPGAWRDRTLALALQIGDDRAAADAALRRVLDTDGRSKSDAYTIARIHALRGDARQAFAWMQRDWDRGDNGVQTALIDPFLLRFRDDARFAAYCKQVGLPPPGASEALSLDQIRASLASGP
jgi:TolB-like protein/DNA-binding winged helix-turn-helix (wHTH) protein/Tfp pilus assembly protein PilF